MRSRGGEKFRPPMAEIHRKDGSWLSDCTTNGIVVLLVKLFCRIIKTREMLTKLAGAEPNLCCDLV